MLPVYEDYFFAQGYFVAQKSTVAADDALPDAAGTASASATAATESLDEQAEVVASALTALWHYARIRITAHHELADAHMLEVAQRNLGIDVPIGFYRGFPSTVRTLTPAQKLFDQLLHYWRTYGMGDFSQAGHSVFEARYERLAFAENVAPKEFAIITADEAEELIARAAEGFLASTRPLNDTNQKLLETYLIAHPEFPVEQCRCKDTAVRIILETDDLDFVRFIELSDVIRLVEWLHQIRYQDLKLVSAEYGIGYSIVQYVPVSETKKLNLRNRDRKLIVAVLDQLFERDDVDVDTCLEKKRVWKGLLHHLHYKPTCAEAEEFCAAIRGKERRSVYSAMERHLAAGDVRGATDALLKAKGPGAVLRHLDHLLSRIDVTGDPTYVNEDVEYVLGACVTSNKIILVQLLLKYGAQSFVPYAAQQARDFSFVHLGQLRKHHETPQEVARRNTVLPDILNRRVAVWLHEQLERVCHGTLGKVYVADDLRHVAVPLQEGPSMGGFGTLPRGTRIPLPAGKKVRAFTYWEKVHDIDLSCFALFDNGETREFSWRTMSSIYSNALVYSGDETSGYDGGSEYFDVEAAALAKECGAGCHYLVFCDNVYSAGTFDRCVCRAGYMLRDIEDSGEVFEPATVESSFVVDCQSKAAYLFALDLQDPAFIWLNIGEHSLRSIAGEGDMRFLLKYLRITDAFNVRDFATMLATEAVDAPEEADVVFADATAEELGLREDQELIRPRNTARLLELLNA